MPGFVGFPELLLLGLVVLLVFGPKRLPEMGRSLGRGMREFKNSVTDHHDGNFAVPQESDAIVTAAAEPVVDVTHAPIVVVTPEHSDPLSQEHVVARVREREVA